jgi:peptidoglycan biosynthesis protein MviN/MurJ (putative lipid II flippase)
MTKATANAESGGLGRASALLASGTLVSRLLGFVSAMVLAQTLGTQTVGGNTFALANQLPNNIYAIVAGGVLSAVLVPRRPALHQPDRDPRYRRFSRGGRHRHGLRATTRAPLRATCRCRRPRAHP